MIEHFDHVILCVQGMDRSAGSRRSLHQRGRCPYDSSPLWSYEMPQAREISTLAAT